MNNAASESNKRKKEYDTVIEKINTLPQQIQTETDATRKAALEAELADAQNAAPEALSNYQSAYANYESYRSNFQTAEDNASMAEAALKNANDTYSGYAGRLSYSMDKATDSKEKYINYQDAAAVVNKINNIASNEYSFASNMYTTEKNTLEGLKQNAISLESEVITAKEQVDLKKEVLSKNFEATKDGIISGLDLELGKLTRNLTKTEIVSTQTGEVKEVVISPGTALQAGSQIIKVLKGKADTKEAICYAPVSLGKKIRPGMEVMIYPTTTNKQEHGHMVGNVKSVAVYVTSQAELMKRLGDDTLAETFLKNGPVVEVVCEIKEDEATNSGFYWSSKKGKEVNIDEGTIFNANVVVEKKAPISMVIPILKDKLTIKPIQK